jgi:Xaa-Pro aminopeptidase
MQEASCEALLVSALANVRYLTGFSGSAAMLLVLERGAVLVTDGRYATQAAEELVGTGAEARVEALGPSEHSRLLKGLLAGTARLGLEAEHVSWADRQRYSEDWAEGTELQATTGLVERLRVKKDPGELARMAAAAAVADEAFAAVRGWLDDGPTEAELALALDTEMRRLGADGPAFETIVASGPNAAKPHHRPSSRQVRPGELVVLDLGARVDGYCSDMTRTVWAGEPGEVGTRRSAGGAGSVLAAGVPAAGEGAGGVDLRRLLSVVLESQQAGLAAVRDGVPAAEVDRACREVIEAAGLGGRFVHGTGHGVGLDIHEAPALASTSSDILGCGHVVTVEPGVYLAGVAGARIEDTVVVGETGCKALTTSPKEAPGNVA